MNKTSIHLTSDSVQIETVREGRRTIKNTTIPAIQEILTRNERVQTPLLPFGWGVQRYLKIDNREQYVIATPETRHTASYDMRGETGDREPAKFEIVAPAALWIFHVEHNPQTDTRTYRHGVAYAIKQQVLTMNDVLYKFPFSNTDGDYLCWGNESDYPVLGGSKSIMTIPDRFFANPFNSDLDGNKYNSFREEVNGQTVVRERCIHLLQHMDKDVKEKEAKGEIPKFRNDILQRVGTLGDILERHTANRMPR